MYERSESGEGTARNFVSQSRSALADSGVKPRRSSLGDAAGVAARSKPRLSTISGRANAGMAQPQVVKAGMVYHLTRDCSRPARPFRLPIVAFRCDQLPLPQQP